MMRPIKNQRGQELAELGFTIVLFTLLTLGVIEFGRMLMIVSVVTHAARDGARMAAVGERDGSGNLTTAAKDAVKARVASQIAQVTAVTFTIPDPTQTTDNTIPMVNVRVTGNVPWLFGPLLPVPANLSIDRTVSFRDEGK